MTLVIPFFSILVAQDLGIVWKQRVHPVTSCGRGAGRRGADVVLRPIEDEVLPLLAQMVVAAPFAMRARDDAQAPVADV